MRATTKLYTTCRGPPYKGLLPEQKEGVEDLLSRVKVSRWQTPGPSPPWWDGECRREATTVSHTKIYLQAPTNSCWPRPDSRTGGLLLGWWQRLMGVVGGHTVNSSNPGGAALCRMWGLLLGSGYASAWDTPFLKKLVCSDNNIETFVELTPRLGLWSMPLRNFQDKKAAKKGTGYLGHIPKAPIQVGWRCTCFSSACVLLFCVSRVCCFLLLVCWLSWVSGDMR